MNHRIALFSSIRFFASVSALTLSMTAAMGCSADAEGSPLDGESAASAATDAAGADKPADDKATKGAKSLLQTLQSYQKDAGTKRLLFGQQEADVATTSSYGLKPLTSDVERVTGKLPAIISYEISNVYSGSKTMFDPAGFQSGAPALKDLIVNNHKKGIAVSLVWHMRCPKAASNSPDKYGPSDCPSDYNMEELLEKKSDGKKGQHFDEWRAMLDELADLLKSAKDDKGEIIPVQLRPFHEFTGNWFWWGRTNKPENYKKAWQEMVSYLQDKKGIHNVLWVFCPDKPTDEWQVKDGGKFEDFYPGDDYVDVVGFDRYDFNDGKFAAGYQADIDAIGTFAKAHGKVAAVTEVGLNFKEYGVSANATWFTKSMLAPLTSTAGGKAFSYVALWRNAPWEKYMPEPSDGAIVLDFKSMSTSGNVVFSASGGNGAVAPAPSTPPKCKDPKSDSDGDGWGWENNQSCKVGA